jgi:hypothetical protein
MGRGDAAAEATRRGCGADSWDPRLDEFIETYWAMHAIPNLEQTTRDNYAHVWEKHIRPRIGDRRLRDISPKVVNRLRAEMVQDGVGSNTTRRALVVLQSILTLAVAEEEIADNPAAKIRKPSQAPAREHMPIPVLTLERMRGYMEPRDQALLSGLHTRGCDRRRRWRCGGRTSVSARCGSHARTSTGRSCPTRRRAPSATSACSSR